MTNFHQDGGMMVNPSTNDLLHEPW